ncbi:hypothetical protein GPJ56_004982 [Histomonas meleagridis]|uniref:uncharacterized protein n=1 Tax=Histomonas meleagridis TaxID=135588 RepID=UPI003559C929|nr:hypothetical protein GPJ56_004982 [Histomonas meleagridis]KAH0798281.1 hypothetical protein GO595_008918 [Histomonas meleagridis]
MEYPVQSISAPRIKKGVVSFLVHWGTGEFTREPLECLVPGSLDLLYDWIKTHRPNLRPEIVHTMYEQIESAIKEME